jgi:hypothetical protein
LIEETGSEELVEDARPEKVRESWNFGAAAAACWVGGAKGLEMGSKGKVVTTVAFFDSLKLEEGRGERGMMFEGARPSFGEIHSVLGEMSGPRSCVELSSRLVSWKTPVQSRLLLT